MRDGDISDVSELSDSDEDDRTDMMDQGQGRDLTDTGAFESIMFTVC